jgi:uroporphyrinogen decarboxylase
MPQETMTSRERWQAVLQREKPDRLPLDYWATDEATAKLLNYLGCDYNEMQKRLHLDVPHYVGGRYVGPAPPEGEDIWGLSYQPALYGDGQR